MTGSGVAGVTHEPRPAGESSFRAEDLQGSTEVDPLEERADLGRRRVLYG